MDWYKKLPMEEILIVDQYTEKWPNHLFDKFPNKPYNSFQWHMTPEKLSYWDVKSQQAKGIISESMGVNTKPAHKFNVKGYWILVDPTITDDMLENLKNCLMKIK